VAALCSAFAFVFAVRVRRAWLVATVVAALSAMAACVAVFVAGEPWLGRIALRPGGEALQFRLDAISAVFLALLSLIGGLAAVYGQGYWRDEQHPGSAPSGRVWWTAVLISMTMVLLATNGIHFLIAWELFSVCVYFLIARERHRTEVRSAAWLFFAASRAGTLCLVAFFVGLAARTGSWELGPMHDHPELAPLFWLALCGFGLKAGMFPLHIWLPSAHANAPSHVSALLSGVSIKMGIYGLVRFSGWMPVPSGAGWVVASLGATSSVLGVAFALGQHDLKRLLAYHSVENIGIILTGLGFAMIASAHGHEGWGLLALTGCLLHVWNHGIFKALLFLGAGSVLHATGTREMSRLGGLWRVMPWTAGTFALGAAAISGLPPLNGFVSEWLVFMGLFGAMSAPGPWSWAAVPALILLGMTGAMALACFAKACGVVFLGTPRTEAAARAHEGGWLMRAPMLVLGGLCVTIGIAPALFWPAVASAAGAWRGGWAGAAVPPSLIALGKFHAALVLSVVLGVTLLRLRVKKTGVTRAVTWDCGYAAPTARMQYTAGSFAAIIVGWFGWILRPQRHVHGPESLFPARASFEEHTPETVLAYIIEPAGRAVMFAAVAARRLQHGRLQAYILYVVIGVIGLAILAALAGTR
jgi:hydrogenase-4 component B